ncbi:MAG TPA: glutamine--fructose-6-phosphate transaminase (isomerizing) [Chloroflexota bacterium]|nr:glutamine--fructose-6-phosphate transaminase (isomerizing) [Chloroflexota bacterium]
MCGIFGFVSQSRRPSSTVLEGLRYLEYRGYDSWGVAVAEDCRIRADKNVGPITDASTTLPAATAALGHTRWATHGAVTRDNAHPHLDCQGRFALIHNGIVENYRELGARLGSNHVFRSQTDTEVLVHLLEEEMPRHGDLLEALLAVFREVEGLSAVAVLDAARGEIAVAKNGSPVALGIGEDGYYLASDPIALLDHTRTVVFLEDGQAAILTGSGWRVCRVSSGETIDPELRVVAWDTRQAGLDGHAHFMDKEIHEQPRVLQALAERSDRSVTVLADMIKQARDVYLIGCGTSHHAALSGRYMLAEMGGVRSTAVVASEMSLITPHLGAGSLIIAFSQSGETVDVIEAVRAARSAGAEVAAVVNGEGSSLDRLADHTVLLSTGPERCVLATKSYTAMLAVMQMAARAAAGDAERGIQEIRDAGYRVGALLDRERIHGTVRDTAHAIGDRQHMFVLGRHRCYPLALEAALKIKEVSYLHAEGFASGELKHGVIALITNGTPCLVLAPDGDYRREALAAAAEVRARGAFTVGFSPQSETEFDVTLPLSGSCSSAYEIAVLAQLLAYELALLRGCDPDKPRNLAKSVTVK